MFRTQAWDSWVLRERTGTGSLSMRKGRLGLAPTLSMEELGQGLPAVSMGAGVGIQGSKEEKPGTRTLYRAGVAGGQEGQGRS